jgi:hypothetical protein
VIGTGGVFAHRADGGEILGSGLARRGPRSLAPLDPVASVDGGYVLATAGLLAELDPDLAFEILERALPKN